MGVLGPFLGRESHWRVWRAGGCADRHASARVFYRRPQERLRALLQVAAEADHADSHAAGVAGDSGGHQVSADSRETGVQPLAAESAAFRLAGGVDDGAGDLPRGQADWVLGHRVRRRHRIRGPARAHAAVDRHRDREGHRGDGRAELAAPGEPAGRLRVRQPRHRRKAAGAQREVPENPESALRPVEVAAGDRREPRRRAGAARREAAGLGRSHEGFRTRRAHSARTARHGGTPA